MLYVLGIKGNKYVDSYRLIDKIYRYHQFALQIVSGWAWKF